MSLERRAAAHAALGDAKRLLIVDHLMTGDRTVAELADVSGMPGNLLAHHLEVLESAGLLERRVSEGDHRRKYVSLRRHDLPPGMGTPPPSVGEIAFLCTHNSARSQFAAALWERVTDRQASSAGTHPAPRVHPTAVRVAEEFGVDLSRAQPKGYEALHEPDLVVTVCDRAREAELPPAAAHSHWSVPDPVPVGTVAAFRSAFGEIAQRMAHLVDRD